MNLVLDGGASTSCAQDTSCQLSGESIPRDGAKSRRVSGLSATLSPTLQSIPSLSARIQFSHRLLQQHSGPSHGCSLEFMDTGMTAQKRCLSHGSLDRSAHQWDHQKWGHQTVHTLLHTGVTNSETTQKLSLGFGFQIWFF